MKKTVRLTENDIVRIIKKVLNEQTQPDLETKVKNCFMGAFEIKDINKVPISCIELGVILSKEERLPNPFDSEEAQLSLKCASGLSKDPQFVASKMGKFLDCMKKDSIVMY